jgi:hypothetical protein
MSLVHEFGAINMKFQQSTKQFLSSKSNWTAVVMIGFAGYGIYTGQMGLDSSMQMILGGLAVIGIKDAVSKNKDEI